MFSSLGLYFISFFRFVNDFYGLIVVTGGIQLDALYLAHKAIFFQRMEQPGIVQKHNMVTSQLMAANRSPEG
jgi:hypothetical protein